jgi:hypothetical protein
MTTPFELPFGTPIKPKLLFVFFSHATFHGLSVAYEDESGVQRVVGRIVGIALDGDYTGDDITANVRKITFNRSTITGPDPARHARDVAAIRAAGFTVEYRDA